MKRKLFYKRAYGTPDLYEEYEPHITLAVLPNKEPDTLRSMLDEILGAKNMELSWPTYMDQLRIDIPGVRCIVNIRSAF